MNASKSATAAPTIDFPRCVARKLRSVLRRAGIRDTQAASQLTVASSSEGLQLCAGNDQVSIEYRHTGVFPEFSFAVPLLLLSDCEAKHQRAVTISPAENSVSARWTDGGVPQLSVYDRLQPTPFPTFGEFTENDGSLLVALRDASQTAVAERLRYALDCIQLRGQTGSIAATDGRQILLQSGFRFPWKEDLLVPAINIWASPELGETPSGPVGVARRDEWVALQTGPWTIALKIDDKGRFPDVDCHVRDHQFASTQCELSDADAQFAVVAIKNLPITDEHHLPVTLDLNGSVTVRAGNPSDPSQPVELVLAHSTVTGKPVRVNSSRNYLQRAFKLGFRRLHVFGKEQPVLCQDARRSYVLAALEASTIVPTSPHAVQIDSAAAQCKAAVDSGRTAPTSRKQRVVKDNHKAEPTSQNRDSRSAESDTAAGDAQLIEQATAAKASLRQALQDVNGLIAGLRRQRKQAKLVRTTLKSLKQLQTIPE